MSEIARGVRTEVAALADSIGHAQSPAYYDELNQEVVLFPEEEEAVPVAENGAPDAGEAFDVARQLNSIEGWQVFLKAYDKGFHSDMAQVALRELLDRSIGPTKITATAEDGLVARVTVPLKGKIEDWSYQFSFTSECENDHQAMITAPNGSAIEVMYRGLKRCSGIPVVFSSEEDHPPGLAGQEASGEWRFSIRDLDANEHTGTLDTVRLWFLVRNNDIVTEQTVVLTGLPAAIPSP